MQSKKKLLKNLSGGNFTLLPLRFFSKTLKSSMVLSQTLKTYCPIRQLNPFQAITLRKTLYNILIFLI